MRTTTKFIFAGAIMMAALLSSSSCKKDNPSDDGSTSINGEVVDLVLESASVTVGIGETVNVNITSGNGDYKVVPADAGVATATVSGQVITVTGVGAGTTVLTVSDKASKVKPLSVSVTKGGSNAIRTDVTYGIDVFSNETGASYAPSWTEWSPTLTSHVSGTFIATKRDIDNNAANALLYRTQDAVQEYIAGDGNDDDIIFLGGYIADGNAPDYGYSAVAVKLTGGDDASHPGCKVVTVLSSCLSGSLGWEDGKYVSRPGTAYYDPSDGSITLVNCYGELYWGGGNSLTWKFNLNRKYTPEN